MKKVLTIILVFAMIISMNSMSVFAGKDEKDFDSLYNNTKEIIPTKISF